MDIYNSTNGSNWSNRSGWSGSGLNINNNLDGIETATIGGETRVTRVDLWENNLNGSLPSSIGDLDEVTYLNTKGNYLTGRIPTSIGNMASLKTLILAGRNYELGPYLKEPPQNLDYAYHPGKYNSSTNRFSGTIPASFGNLSNLLFLEISDQPDITGPIPSSLGNLSNLKGIYLNQLDFEGYSLPSSFGNLTELRHFYFSSSNLSGQLPASLENLTKLTYFQVVATKTFGKGLTGSIPDLSNYTNLRTIYFNKNELSGEYPSYLNNGNFTKLHILGFAWNNLTGTLHGFNNMPAIEVVELVGNELSGSIGSQLLQLSERTQIVSLGWNNFSGGLPFHGYPDFFQLKTLYFSDNQLTGAIPCDFWNKIDNPKLGITWLGNNEFNSNCTSAMNNVEGNDGSSGNALQISVGGNNF